MPTTKKKLPRGIRNNNPLNIRIGNTWLGERKPEDCTDPEFEQFVAMEYGLRAAFCILRRYIRHYHRNTIRMIVYSWAPPKENDSDKYINFVSKRVGCAADDEIFFEDMTTMCALVQAMAQYECGMILPLADIEKGYKIA